LVVERFCPEKLEDFEEDFATCALSVGNLGVAEKSFALTPPARGLDTTLVSGMFFQVLMEAASLPTSSQERVAFIRKKTKDYLVTHLAGQITLSQFYRLLNLIEEEAGLYFARQDWSGDKCDCSKSREVSPPLRLAETVKKEALRQALAQIALPTKGRRKLTPETLWDFLRETEGRWFRLLDFEGRFQVNKKTAWSYLNLLLQKGVLVHNGEKANRVRYALAPSLQANSAGLPGAESLKAVPSPPAGPA